MLVFASNRPGGYGGFDLWYSLRVGETYEEARRLLYDSRINTAYDEMEPALSADGCELFFVSNQGVGANFEIYSALFEP